MLLHHTQLLTAVEISASCDVPLSLHVLVESQVVLFDVEHDPTEVTHSSSIILVHAYLVQRGIGHAFPCLLVGGLVTTQLVLHSAPSQVRVPRFNTSCESFQLVPLWLWLDRLFLLCLVFDWNVVVVAFESSLREHFEARVVHATRPRRRLSTQIFLGAAKRCLVWRPNDVVGASLLLYYRLAATHHHFSVPVRLSSLHVMVRSGIVGEPTGLCATLRFFFFTISISTVHPALIHFASI